MENKISNIRNILSNGECAIISGASNRFYLTNFRSSAGYCLITADKALFFTDSRYYENACRKTEEFEVILLKNWFSQLKEVLKSYSIKKIYIETKEISVSLFSKYQSHLENTEISNNTKLDRILSEMRSVKSKKELELIKSAQSITDDAFSHILNFIKRGKTEHEIALELEFFMRKNGSEGVAFDTIAVSGENSSLPHGVPTDRKLKDGDFLTMDFGAVVGGYCSDMTRTVAIGNVSEEQIKVYETVLSAQTAALDGMYAGITGKDADFLARNVIKNAGYGEHFGHSLGHSVGIDIHEIPNASPNCEDVLKEGVVITVEPGIYIPQKFGVRIEDMVYLTADRAENLTHSPKDLIML